MKHIDNQAPCLVAESVHITSSLWFYWAGLETGVGFTGLPGPFIQSPMLPPSQFPGPAASLCPGPSQPDSWLGTVGRGRYPSPLTLNYSPQGKLTPCPFPELIFLLCMLSTPSASPSPYSRAVSWPQIDGELVHSETILPAANFHCCTLKLELFLMMYVY